LFIYSVDQFINIPFSV